MVRNASAVGKRRGRPPSYDPDGVVQSAMTAFWTKGFESTTLTDLETATGVDRSTLYYSFGGKHGLYRKATAAYLGMAEQHLFAGLSSGHAGIADIVDLLEAVRTELASDKSPKGCLIVNDLASPADQAATDQYLRLLRRSIGTALKRSAAMGETDSAKAVQRTQLLSAALVGINLVSRTDNDNQLTTALIEGAIAEVESWPESDRSTLSD